MRTLSRASCFQNESFQQNMDHLNSKPSIFPGLIKEFPFAIPFHIHAKIYALIKKDRCLSYGNLVQIRRVPSTCCFNLSARKLRVKIFIGFMAMGFSSIGSDSASLAGIRYNVPSVEPVILDSRFRASLMRS